MDAALHAELCGKTLHCTCNTAAARQLGARVSQRAAGAAAHATRRQLAAQKLPMPKPNHSAMQMRELIEQQVPLIAFQHGMNFVEAFLPADAQPEPRHNASGMAERHPLVCWNRSCDAVRMELHATQASLVQVKGAFTVIRTLCRWMVGRLCAQHPQAGACISHFTCSRTWPGYCNHRFPGAYAKVHLLGQPYSRVPDIDGNNTATGRISAAD